MELRTGILYSRIQSSLKASLTGSSAAPTSPTLTGKSYRALLRPDKDLEEEVVTRISCQIELPCIYAFLLTRRYSSALEYLLTVYLCPLSDPVSLSHLPNTKDDHYHSQNDASYACSLIAIELLQAFTVQCEPHPPYTSARLISCRAVRAKYSPNPTRITPRTIIAHPMLCFGICLCFGRDFPHPSQTLAPCLNSLPHSLQNTSPSSFSWPGGSHRSKLGTPTD